MNEKIDAAVQIARDLRARLRDAGMAGTKVAVRTRLWDEVPKFAQLDLLRIALREGVNVGNVHAVHARANPERLALVDARYAWDFVETNDKINQVCHAFTHLVPRGERPRVILCMENRVEYALIWFALFRLGWAAVHASNAATVEELRYLFEGSEAAIAVGSESTRERLEGAAPSGCNVLSVDTLHKGAKSIDFHKHIAGFPRTHFRRERSASGENVVYTSGTTGKPKGAVRDFGGMGVMELVEILERMPISLEERHLVVSKLYHSAGQAFTLIMAALGATIYIEDDFDPEALLKAIHTHKITSMFMVPTMISRVLQVDDDIFAQHPPTELATIISGAGLFTHALRERAIARFGADTIHDFYGASELGWVTLINGREMLERKGSQGRPLRGQEVRIVEGKRVLPPHEIGLIQVRTQTRMEGYLGDDASSQEILSEDDWMTVDDTGYMDEEGYLYLVGRARDMIISGGVNIYPAEIEEALIRHPDVTEVSVVGAPDEEWGEKLVGFVVGNKDLNPLAVQKWAREYMSGYKVPREWFRIPELPRNPTGKVLKKDLELVAAVAEGKQLPKDASDIAKDVFKDAERFNGKKKKADAKKTTAKKASAKQADSSSKAAPKKAAAKKSTAKKAAPNKSTAKKTTAKKTTAKKSTAKKTAAQSDTKDNAEKTVKKAAAKKAAPKKAAAKKSTAKKATPNKSTAKKTTAKKTTAKKSTAKKTAAKKADAKKSSAQKSDNAAPAEKRAPAKKKAAASKPKTPKKARSPRGARRK